MTRMNLKLQKNKIIEKLKKYDSSVDWEQEIDWNAVLDKNLHYDENFNKICEEMGINPNLLKVSKDEVIKYEKNAREKLEEEILKDIKQEPVLDFQQTHKEICNFSYLCEDYTYSTIFALISNDFILNKGNFGIGKSRSSCELINYLNESGYSLPKTIILSGYLTPKRFFKLLKQYNDCCIVFDEADLILENKLINRILKSILTSRKAIWESDKEEDELEFNGSLILNCNNFNFGTGIEDKIMVNQNSLSTNDFKEKIKQIKNYKPNRKIWDKIKERIIYVRNNNIELTDKEKELVYNYIFNVSYIDSYRFIRRCFKIFENLKKLYGNINKNVYEFGKHLCNLQINKQDVLSKILESFDNEIESKELVEKIANIQQISIRTAHRRVNELIEQGYLSRINKFKLVKTT